MTRWWQRKDSSTTAPQLPLPPRSLPLYQVGPGTAWRTAYEEHMKSLNYRQAVQRQPEEINEVLKNFYMPIIKEQLAKDLVFGKATENANEELEEKAKTAEKLLEEYF